MHSLPTKNPPAGALPANSTGNWPKRWAVSGLTYPEPCRPVKLTDWRKYYLRKKAKYRERMNAQSRIRNRRYRDRLKRLANGVNAL